MGAAYSKQTTESDVFSAAREQAEAMEAHLRSSLAMAARHEELEAYVQREGREWLRRMMQAHLDMRAALESPVDVRGADGVRRGYARPDRSVGSNDRNLVVPWEPYPFAIAKDLGESALPPTSASPATVWRGCVATVLRRSVYGRLQLVPVVSQGRWRPERPVRGSHGDGKGACELEEPEPCGAYACGERTCLTECTADADCARDHQCVEAVCVAKPPAPPQHDIDRKSGWRVSAHSSGRA